jgi:hypothetical protein
VLEVKVNLFIGTKKMAQLHSKNVGEIDSCDQFNHHFMRGFCANILAPKK